MARGTFVGRDGHRYSVEFTGNGVSNKALDIVGVVIAMDAQDRKFVGFKSSTARISILTDSPLVELYAASPRDIRVVVSDMESGDVVFVGYVVPFVYSQPYTGTADVFEVNCVDAITASKDIPYYSAQDDDKHGIDETAYTIIEQVRYIAGTDNVKRIYYHENFGGLTEPLEVKVAQAGFLQDNMSGLDALTAVCMFFGYTATMVGDSLYIYDEHCLTHAEDGYKRRLISYDWSTGKRVYDFFLESSDGNPLRLLNIDPSDVHDDITLSIERAYDAIQIKPSGREVSVLCPDICSPDEVETNEGNLGTDTRYYQDNYKDGDNVIDYEQWRTPVQSKVMDIPDMPDGGDKMHPEKGGSSAWTTGAILFEYTNQPRQRLSINGVTTAFPKSSTTGILLQVRAAATSANVASQKKTRCYSHTGGYYRLVMTYRVVNVNKYPELDNEIKQEGVKAVLIPQLRSGEVFFKSDAEVSAQAVWSAAPSASWKTLDGVLLPTITAAILRKSEVIIKAPNDGQVALSVEWDIAGGYTNQDIYIESLMLEAVGDEIRLDDREFRHDYVSKPTDVLEVETNLTTRKTAHVGVGNLYGVNARPSVVTSEEFSGGYMYEGSKSIPVCGILMMQLKARYGAPRKRYAMTVDGYIKPSDTCEWLGDMYTVEGYERDLVNNTTQIIIN